MPEEFNSYYIENGSFWKIDNVTLSYTFKKLDSKWLHGLRVYCSTLNTFLFTKYKGTDPEVPLIGSTVTNQGVQGTAGLTPGIDSRDTYPTTRTYTVGVTANF
jgi:hypothetical protein